MIFSMIKSLLRPLQRTSMASLTTSTSLTRNQTRQYHSPELTSQATDHLECHQLQSLSPPSLQHQNKRGQHTNHTLIPTSLAMIGINLKHGHNQPLAHNHYRNHKRLKFGNSTVQTKKVKRIHKEATLLGRQLKSKHMQTVEKTVV